MKTFKLLTAAFLAVALSGCQSDQKPTDADFGSNSEKVYRDVVGQLASDSFMGRKPFTKGEDITTAYLEKKFKEVGLQPGNNGSYFQDVPMVEITGQMKDNVATITGNGKMLKLAAATDIVGTTLRVVPAAEINSAPLVFAGFGINAPEYHWNDYAGVDVKGKVVVVMVNDPGFYNPKLFRGKNMTYYGRWTYKYEEAARQGAVGVLIIHATDPASYDWEVVREGWTGAKLSLQTKNNNMDRTAFDGWVTSASAQKIFDLAGMNGNDLLEKAKQPGFKAVPLDLNFSETLENKIVKRESKNVVGILPGTSEKDQVVIFSAHWDHFGIGKAVDGDSIYNGAVDNASGVAALVTLAQKFAKAKKTKRTLMFIALTGEEQGLLGSQYYAEHPIYPLKNTVADINFDVMQPFGLMKDIILVGKGMSDIDQYMEDAAKQQGRVIRGEDNPSAGTYFRSDHFNFAKVGIPAIYIETGTQSVDHGNAWGEEQHKEYNRNKYHKPQDNYSPSWNVQGTMADLKLVYAAVTELANDTRFPQWNDGVPFKKARNDEK